MRLMPIYIFNYRNNFLVQQYQCLMTFSRVDTPKISIYANWVGDLKKISFAEWYYNSAL